MGKRAKRTKPQPNIRWIIAVYGNRKERTHVAVPDNGRSALQKMADDLAGTHGQVALYVPEGTDEVYKPGEKRGRVIGVVELLPMPAEQTMSDFFYDDWDGSRRWPIGWPCRLVCEPPEEMMPSLREHVESLYGVDGFRSYVKRFQQGPIDLGADMQERLNRDFAAFPPFI